MLPRCFPFCRVTVRDDVLEGVIFEAEGAFCSVFTPGDMIPETSQSVDPMCVFPQEIPYFLGNIFMSHALPCCLLCWGFAEDFFRRSLYPLDRPLRGCSGYVSSIGQVVVDQALAYSRQFCPSGHRVCRNSQVDLVLVWVYSCSLGSQCYELDPEGIQ